MPIRPSLCAEPVALPHPAVPVSRLLGFIDTRQLDARLHGLLPDAADRAFVVRCLVGEGPMHHRGANYVLLSLLAEAVERLPVAASPVAGAAVAVPMRLPPHLHPHHSEPLPAGSAGTYPVALPLAPLAGLAAGRPADVEAMADCLTDGPPQHALANVLMVALLERLLAQLPPPAGDAAEPGA